MVLPVTTPTLASVPRSFTHVQFISACAEHTKTGKAWDERHASISPILSQRYIPHKNVILDSIEGSTCTIHSHECAEHVIQISM